MASKQTVATISQADHDEAMRAAREEYSQAAEARQTELSEVTAERDALAGRLAAAEGDLRAARATAATEKQALVDAFAADKKTALQEVVDQCNAHLKQYEQQIAQLTAERQFQATRADMATALVNHQADDLTREMLIEHELIGQKAAVEARLAAVQAALETKRKAKPQ